MEERKKMCYPSHRPRDFNETAHFMNIPWEICVIENIFLKLGKKYGEQKF